MHVDDQRPDPVPTDGPLSPDELAAQQAADLPPREALSLVDPSTLLGGASLPAGTPSAAGSPTTPAAAPTSTDPASGVSLPGSLGGVSNKIVNLS